jgi:MFS family permease
MTYSDGAASPNPRSVLTSLTAFFQTKPSKSSKPPLLLSLRSSTAFIVFVVCLAIFTDILFYGLIVPVLPFSLSAQVGVPEHKVQHWTAILLACYNAALFVGSPVAGWYADRTASRRWPFLLGLLALCASTLLLCLGRTLALLVVGRVLQGVSAAIVWSVGLALLVDTVGRDVGYAMGYVNIAMSVGLLISPAIGGAVYAAAGYYAVYYVAFAVIVCDIALRLVMIEKKVARQWLGDGGAETRRGPDPAAAERARTRGGEKEEEGCGSAASPPTCTGTDSDADATPCVAARHPHRELIRTPRVLAVLLGVVVQAAIV